jgi:hypothetical protein
MINQSPINDPLILELVGQLSDAIRMRILTDPTFDPVADFLNPLQYQPVTDLERAVWERLTHPELHARLAEFVRIRSCLPISNYAKGIDQLLLMESQRRLLEAEATAS